MFQAGRRKQFSSCDSCRRRKAKCEWLEGQPECIPCKSKGLQCSRVFITLNSHGRGRLLDQARTDFGTRDETSGRIFYTSESSSSSDTSASPWGTPVCEDGANGKTTSQAVLRLNNKAVSANALCAFLQAFDSEVWPSLPVIDYGRLFQACAAVNFDVHALNTFDRLLCLAAASVATNTSQADHKFGKGEYEMTLRNPLSVKRDLEAQVLNEADRIGLTRQPSKISLQILRLLCVLSSGQDCRRLSRSDTYRHYEQGLVEHMRTLASAGQLDDVTIAQYFWSVALSDSFASAISGRQPSLNDEDIETFTGYTDYSSDVIIKVISDLGKTNPCDAYGYIAACQCRMLRCIYSQVTSRRARKRPQLELNIMEDLCVECERIIALLDLTAEKIEQLHKGEDLPEVAVFLNDLSRFLFTSIFTIAIEETEKAMLREVTPQMSVPRLLHMQTTLGKLQSRLMAELKYSTGWSPQLSVARVVASSDGLMGFHSTVRLKQLLKLPAAEESGRPEYWTGAEKLAAALYYAQICTALSSAIPEVAAELPTLQEEVSKLEKGLKRYQGGSLASTIPGSATMTELHSQSGRAVLRGQGPPLIFGNSLDCVPLSGHLFESDVWNGPRFG